MRQQQHHEVQANRFGAFVPDVQVHLVDNWHDHWNVVLALVDRFGKRPCLQLDEDGWMSARQNLLVAFDGNTPVGFICFQVAPGLVDGRVAMTAHVETCAVERTGPRDPDAISHQLHQAARARAQELRCQRFTGTTCADA